MTVYSAPALRIHPGSPTVPLPLTRAEQAALEDAVRLLMAEGWTAAEIALRVGVRVRAVERWRARFVVAAEPVAALADAPRSGRPRSFVRTD
jgi:hypothetical protein